MPANWNAVLPTCLAITICLFCACNKSGFALKLDNNFYDLFSLSRIYDRVKYGDIAQLHKAYQEYHINENTARLLFTLARAFTTTKIMSEKDFILASYISSSLDPSVCDDYTRFSKHQQIDVQCHFQAFVTCVEGVLQRPADCLMASEADRGDCPQAKLCNSAYNHAAEGGKETRAWLQLWAEETMQDLVNYRNNTPTEIAAMLRKSCLHDSQFLSAIYNLALCSEISRQASLMHPRIVHPLAEIYCPDPCLRRPCASRALRHQLINTECSSLSTRWESRHAIAHMWDDLQLQLQHDMPPQYTCACRYGSWSPVKQACEHVSGGDFRTCSPTLANRYFPCDAFGTVACYENSESEEIPFICRCRPGFVGVFCHEKVNSCLNLAVDVKLHGTTRRMSGNRMCNVNHGGEPLANWNSPVNTCQPDPKSHGGYNCTCVSPFYRLIYLQTDNCLGARRACDAELCINGECVSTPDKMTASSCRCSPGWAGSLCDVQLEDWSVWTGCRPVCGVNRTRQRRRRGDRRQYDRVYVETELCPSRSCYADTNDLEYSAYQTLTHATSADAAALTGCALLALLSFVGLRFWQPRFAAVEGQPAS